uniref:GP-PDE domain-containing protein n=1 Tax=Macrostomum lignano TaxID=282301 RepID=A0A1I8FFX4_9PLAT
LLALLLALLSFSSEAGRRPWVIAHRGSSGDYPGLTMLAFSQSCGEGADMLEVGHRCHPRTNQLRTAKSRLPSPSRSDPAVKRLDSRDSPIQRAGSVAIMRGPDIIHAADIRAAVRWPSSSVSYQTCRSTSFEESAWHQRRESSLSGDATFESWTAIGDSTRGDGGAGRSRRTQLAPEIHSLQVPRDRTDATTWCSGLSRRREFQGPGCGPSAANEDRYIAWDASARTAGPRLTFFAHRKPKSTA